MATTFLEPGGDADFLVGTTNGFWGTTNVSPAIATDFVHGGHQKSIKYRPANADYVRTVTGIVSDAGTRVSFYIYLVAYPTATVSIARFLDSSLANAILRIQLSSAGVISLRGNAVLGTGNTLSTGVWYRISVAYTVTSTTVNRFELFVNGVSNVSATNASLIVTNSSVFNVGNTDNDSTLDFRTSDHYIDNSSSLTDTGNIWVTAKRPLSNGVINHFNTQIGSGGSGYGSGNSPQVNERPLSTTNGWSTVDSSDYEFYNIEGKSVGDINISAVTIIDYIGWILISSSVNETGTFYLGLSNSAQAITTNPTLYTKIKGSSTYSSGTNQDIGFLTSSAANTVSLYECGVLVAYIPVAPTVTTQAVSSITATGGTGNGNVTSDGGGNMITERGVCVSTSINPTTADTTFTSAGTTGAFTAAITGRANNTLYHVRAYAINSIGTSYGADVNFTTLIASPTVTTQAVSVIKSDIAVGNGNVTSDGGGTITERGICWKTSTGPTTADSKATATGTTGAYTASLTGLLRNTLYYVKAYAINSAGTSYGAEVTFTTIQFTNPANIYASDNTYATLTATSGVLTVEISKDAGANWSAPQTVTFTGSDTLQTVGAGATELFGMSLTRADVTDTNLRIRLSQGNISQIYKTFGFTTGSDILTGIEIAIEGKYASPTMSLDLLEVKIYYGTSTLVVQAGSQAYDSTNGTLAVYNGVNWVDIGAPPDLSGYAPLASPTFTGTVFLPSTTSIGTVSATEIGYVDGVTSAIQTQLGTKAPLASPTFTGTPSLPTGTTGVTQSANDNSTKIATTAYVNAIESAWTIDINPFSIPKSQTNWDSIETVADQFGGFDLSGTADINQQRSYDVILGAGTWTFEIFTLKAIDSGIVKFNIDGSSVGTIDLYSAANVYNQRLAVTGITIATSGKHTLQLIVDAKNASSAMYNCRLNNIRLLRTA